MIVLRKLLIVFLICLLVKAAFSQQQYYIYIQSEDHRPFYVRMGAETLTSSGNGYLVVPDLERNTYELIVGFPETKTTEWRFSCTVSETDLGFILKRKSTAQLQLLNLKQQDALTGTVVEQHPEVKTNAGALPPGMISNDPFSLMLADVVNDPSIRLPVIVEQRTTAPVLALHEDTLKPLVADISPVGAHQDQAATAIVPVTDTKPEPRTETAGNGDERQGSGEVKGIAKAVVAQTDKPSKERTEGKAEKAGSAIVASTEKKYESFVVKETPLPGNTKTEATAAGPETGDSAGAPVKAAVPFVVKEITPSSNTEKAAPATTATEENKRSSDEAKYLPFVIKPGTESQRGVEAQQSKADPAVAVADERKIIPPVVKRDNKQPEEAGKDKSAKAGSGAKDSVATATTRERKPATAEKKAVLSSVKKTLERKGRDGIDLIYIDENINGARDTIRIFIPGVK